MATKYNVGQMNKRATIERMVETERDSFNSYDDTWVPFFQVLDTAELGTNTTNITMVGHGLSTGDYIINTSRSDALRQITKVDDDNITVSSVTDQTDGDSIKKYNTSKSKVWLSIKPYQGIGTSAKKDFIDVHKRAEITHVCFSRYRLGLNDIDTKYRIKFQNRYLYIENIFNIDERRQWIKIMAEEKPV